MASPRLSEGLLLDIVYFCDIPTLKSLRLTHSSMRDLLDTYQNSIYSNAQTQFFQAEEVESFQLLDKFFPALPALTALFALEYRVRAAKWLSAVALEHYDDDEDGYLLQSESFGDYGAGAGADEFPGTDAEDVIFLGWAVLWRLADIARNVVSEKAGISVLRPGTRVSSLTAAYCGVRSLAIETEVKEKQLEYISNLRRHESYGYVLMRALTRHSLDNRVFEDENAKKAGWGRYSESDCNELWLSWLVLREGPDFFLNDWGSKEGSKECSRFIKAEWSKRSQEQTSIEGAAAEEVGERLLRSSESRNEALGLLTLMNWAGETGGEDLEDSEDSEAS